MHDIKKKNGSEIIQMIHGILNKFFSIEKSIHAYGHGVVLFFTRLWKLRKNTGVLRAAGGNRNVHPNIKPHLHRGTGGHQSAPEPR